MALLADVMWHIDGHRKTLRDRGCSVPPMFSEFDGYNCPEKRKARRRGPESLSRQVLQMQSQALLEVTQQPWMYSHKWMGVQEAIKLLAESLNKYSKYLADKNAEVKENHELLQSVRQASQCGVSEGLLVIPRAKFVKPTLAARHSGLEEALSRTEHYSPVYLSDFLPTDRR